jgi:hypothetical protein
MGRFISDVLFHFVGRAHPSDHERNYDVLKIILSQGCVSHPPHDDTWGATSYKIDLSRPLVSEKMLVPTVTCYCDIPFDHLPLHLGKYGKFGLSLNKHLLIKYGARPVIYVPLRSDDWAGSHGGHTWLRDVEVAYRGFRTHIYDKLGHSRSTSRSPDALPTSPEEVAVALDSALTLNFLAFIKPYDSFLSDSDINYFYSEREWRKFGNQRFELQDVEHVVVAKGYIDRLRKELPQYAGKVVLAPE